VETDEEFVHRGVVFSPATCEILLAMKNIRGYRDRLMLHYAPLVKYVCRAVGDRVAGACRCWPIWCSPGSSGWPTPSSSSSRSVG